jgi:hypothetical protein
MTNGCASVRTGANAALNATGEASERQGDIAVVLARVPQGGLRLFPSVETLERSVSGRKFLSEGAANPELERLIIEAQQRFDLMTPEQKKDMRDAQRKSWVVGEFMLSHPEVTREYAEEIYQNVVLGIGL